MCCFSDVHKRVNKWGKSGKKTIKLIGRNIIKLSCTNKKSLGPSYTG